MASDHRRGRYTKLLSRESSSSSKRRTIRDRFAGFLDSERLTWDDMEYAEAVGRSRAVESVVGSVNTGNFDQLRIDLTRQRNLGSPRVCREKNLTVLQKQMWDLWHIEPTVKNAVTMMTAIITGGGVFVDVPEEQKNGVELKRRWDDFNKRNKYTRRMVWKNVHDTLLMGEVVNWFDMSLGGEGEKRGAPERVMTLDFISTGGISRIATNPRNPFVPMVYERRGTFEGLAPEFVTHWKAPAAGNQIHGRPVLESAFDDIWRVRQSGTTLWMQQEWRQRILSFIYKIVNPELADKLPDNLPLPEGLEGLELPPGVDLEIPALKDVIAAGGRLDDTPVVAPLLRVAQAIQLPYHILVMRFNEANFASLLSAEGPTVKVAQYWGSIFEDFVEEDVRKVVGQEAEVLVDIRPTVMRDMPAERSSVVELILSNVLDMRTGRETLGFDHDEVEARLKVQRDGEEEEELETSEEDEDDDIEAAA